MQESYRALVKQEKTRGGSNPYAAEIGLDLSTGDVCVPSLAGIWDSATVWRQLIVLVSTLSAQLLLVDEIIKAGKQMGRGG